MTIKPAFMAMGCTAAMLMFLAPLPAAAQQDGNTEPESGEYVIPGTSTVTSKKMAPSPDASVTGDEIAIPSSNISNMLFGRIPGLIVSQGNGEPGYDAATLNIRGIATYNNSSIPVYVDGFQTNLSYLQFISPSEIESIEILKDAVSLAPFGMRGANGIIWVTTKRGKIGKPEVSVNLKGGLQSPMNIQKPLGTADYTALYNEAISNDNGNVWTPYYTPEAIASLPDVDWYDEVLKDNTPYTEADVSVRGGNDKVKYFVLFGYMGQRGIYDVPTTDTLSNAGIDRYNIRANLDINLFSFLEAKVDVGGRIEDRRYPNRSAGNLWTEMAKYPSSVYPVKNEDGTWTGTPVYNFNPVASINALGRNSTHDRTFQANFELKEKLDFITPGLYLKEALSLSSWTRDGASNTRNYTRWLNGVQQTTDNDTPYTRNEDYGQNQWSWLHFNAMAGYDRVFGDHSLSVSSGILYDIYNTDISANGSAGSQIEYRHMTIGGSASYIFKDRYSAVFSYSVDGSDNYMKGNRWGFYPSLGLTWLASNEPFLKDSRTVSYLKVYATAGRNGWDPLGEQRYLYQGYYTGRGGMNTGNGTPSWHSGNDLSYIPNPDIFAETSWKYDAGVRLQLWKRLDLDVDLFLEKRSGIVTQDWMIPGASGITNPAYRNIGKMTNKGIDARLTWHDSIGDFNYSISGIASFNHNTVDYMAEIITVPSAARTGHRLNSMFGYVADGFYDWEDFDAQGKLKSSLPKTTFGAIQPGDVKYRDLNGDDVIDENDQTIIGDSYLPKLQYSFSISLSWKGIDVFALFQGAAGRDVNLLDAPIQNIAFRDNGNVYKIAEGRWAYYPEQGIDTRATATYPRLSLQDNSNNYITSTLWKRNGDFLKLRNVEIGYTFSMPKLQKAGISKLRVYLCGVNLLTVSELMRDYSIDPELLSGHTALKSYNLGLNIVF